VRWLLWILPPWGRQARRRDWVSVSDGLFEAERRAALQRTLNQARYLPAVRYANVRTAPLLTRGQRARANGGPS
jgi:hypothetical protein